MTGNRCEAIEKTTNKEIISELLEDARKQSFEHAYQPHAEEL